MDTIHFENSALPIYIHSESISNRDVHSEMAHWHDNIELIVVGHGTICCRTNDDRFLLHKGDVCFINRKQLHHIFEAGTKISGHDALDVLIVGTGFLTQNPIIHEKYIRPILEDARFSHMRFEGKSSPAAEISQLVARIKKAEKAKEIGYELEIIAAVYQIFKQLYLAYVLGPTPQPPDNNARLQQQMVEFIYANYAGAISLDDIAHAGSVSRSQCTKLFKRYTEMSPIAFLNHHRLDVSLDLLRNTSGSVAFIAQSCGFSDQSYYNRLFLREYGCTPLAYRKRDV